MEFCPDLKCYFYLLFPDGTDALKVSKCPRCANSLIAEKPLPNVDMPPEPEPSSDFYEDCIIVDDDVSINTLISDHQTSKVNVTFRTAILLSHFPKAESSIYLKFKHFQNRYKVTCTKYVQYEGDTYALLEKSIDIQFLNSQDPGKIFFIPYKYYFLNDQKENYYSISGAAYRVLTFDYSSISKHNNIMKYDFIVLPPNLPSEQSKLYKELVFLLKIVFHLYSPVIHSKEEKILFLSFSGIKLEVQTILNSLCDASYMKTSSLPLSKKKYFHLYQTDEEAIKIKRGLLLEWVDSIVQSDLPFHFKFYLPFLTVDIDLMQERAIKIFSKVFSNISSLFVLSIVSEKSELELFLRYRSQLLESPHLLLKAMHVLSKSNIEKLIQFLPLYHVLFGSELSFIEAHERHDFLSNAYWGFPTNFHFTTNPTIELPVDMMKNYKNSNPILPYSITLLCFRSELFPQFLESLEIPFLPFFSVLLFRIEMYSLLNQDQELRVLVYTRFLTHSEDKPDLLNEAQIFQACDVIFRMIQLMENFSFREVNLLLEVLARLFCLFEREGDVFSDSRIIFLHSKIFHLITSQTLIASIELCVQEMLDQPLQDDEKWLCEVLKWNSLFLIQFPLSYNWVSSISEAFSKRLILNTMQSLLISFVHLCKICTETEISLYLFQNLHTELIHNVETSSSRVEYQQLAIQHLVEVPSNQFSKVIDVFDKIIGLQKPGITGANPVGYLLSLSWMPSLFKYCQPQMLKTCNFPESGNLFNDCVQIVCDLTLAFQNLEIQVNHLKLIIDHKSPYKALLQSLPKDAIPASATELLDESVFDSAIKLRENLLNHFLLQLKQISTLKLLLDSTNYGIYLIEVSEFLDIEYETKAISYLCSTSVDQKIILNPNTLSFNVWNKEEMISMLNAVPDILESQFFKFLFQQNINFLLEKTNQTKAICLDIFRVELLLPTLNFVSETMYEFVNLTILLTKIEKHFGKYRNCPDLIEREINHIISFIDELTGTPCKVCMNPSIDKVKCYFNLKKYERFAISILTVKKAYSFTGNFSQTSFISNLEELNVDDTQLNIITPELHKTAVILSNLTDKDLLILQTLLICVKLFKWIGEILRNPSDLVNFINLAFNSIDATYSQVNRITSFKTVSLNFLPFIFELDNVDELCFLNKLKAVGENLPKDMNEFRELLNICEDCSRENELEFWRELEQSHTEFGGKTIALLKQIIQNGRFKLITNANTRTIEDILQLNVITTYTHVYSLDELREIQSNIILITPEMNTDKDSGRFVALLEEIIALAKLVLKLHNCGNIFFINRTLEYTCDSLCTIKKDILFLREECIKWNSQLMQARNDNYLLNYFTASQILTIQIGLERMTMQIDLDRDTTHLLTLVREELSQSDIDGAFSRISSLECPVLPVHFIREDESYPFAEISEIYETRKNLISLNTIGMFLQHINSQNETLASRPFRLPLKQGEPNLLIFENSLLIYAILSIYRDAFSNLRFPSPHEVLICSAHTTLEELDIFWRKSIFSPSCSEIFCLAFIENLDYEIAVQSVSDLNNYLQLSGDKKYQLVLLCSAQSVQSSYMATALAKFKQTLPQLASHEEMKSYIFHRISRINSSASNSSFLPRNPSSIIDPDKCCVRVVCSDSAGSGKSLTVSRLVDKLKQSVDTLDTVSVYTVITIYESEGIEDKAATKLIESSLDSGEYGRLFHFDITATSYELLIQFLFKLLITRMIWDKNGKPFRCSKRNYYVIEITLSSQSPELTRFLSLFPDCKCLAPAVVLDQLRNRNQQTTATQVSLLDYQEIESPQHKRVFTYLQQLKAKSQNLDDFVYDPNSQKAHSKDNLSNLDLLMRYYSRPQPSWCELKYFISFLNAQLIACEHENYCVRFSTKLDWSWRGFNNFLVNCMISMTRDFIRPSLRNTIEAAPVGLIEGYSLGQHRKWEEKFVPYIFFNEDRQSMTFFGMEIPDDKNQLPRKIAERLQFIRNNKIPEQLYLTLKYNHVEFDCVEWDRKKMINILANVMGIDSPPGPEFDSFYVLTIDNLKKMLAIHMRFRSNIPVIIIGETGCGKTRLIDFMCKIQAKCQPLQNMVVLKIHGETTKNDILKGYEEAFRLAKENVLHGIDTVLFFDEANTSHTMGLIKEILCDKRIDGITIPSNLRLQFVAICNPYRRHNETMINSLTSAGLGLIRDRTQTREHFGNIPMRELVYRVIPLPKSLLPLVWDFGNLNPETEKMYILKIVTIHIQSVKSLLEYCDVVAVVLSAVQGYMRKREDECSFVSLRDVERTVRVMLWFYTLIPKLQIDTTDISLVTYSLILALAVCYRAKLTKRNAFDSFLTDHMVNPLSSIPQYSSIRSLIDECQSCIVNIMKIEERIARNSSLKENLFMMFVCINLKIPLFIIGKPGSSKSLAKSIINHSINAGLLVGGNKITNYDHLYMQSYQCSQYTTSEGINEIFSMCQTIQKECTANSVACVVLDEIGLAEDSIKLPLKVLHSLLEDSATSEFARRGPNVAFVGLSNWALDPAKMNRGIMVRLEDPSIEELVGSAHAIINPSGHDYDIYSENLTPYLETLTQAYLEIFKKQTSSISKDYFGLRDFYCLIKMLYSLCRQYETLLNKRIMLHAVKRNFGGIDDINVVEIFSKCHVGLCDTEVGPLSDPLSLIQVSIGLDLPAQSVNCDLIFGRSRYLLLLTENFVALDILFQKKILNNNSKVLFGSSFPLDKESFNICHSINEIKSYMETGEVVVLTNLSNLYESLYEIMNQSYVKLLGKYWVPIGIGSHRVECPVDPKFRLIVIADKNTVFNYFPPPLINRLEKHILTVSTILPENPVISRIVEKLYVWIENFTTVDFGGDTIRYRECDCFVGLQEDTPSFVIYSALTKLGFERIDHINEKEIFEESKLYLLKLASPGSILRLRTSKLSSEVDLILKKYCSFKLFSLAEYLLQLLSDRTIVRKPPNLSFVSTRSPLLTEVDISEFSDSLKTGKYYFNVANFILNQFNTEEEFVTSIQKEIESLPLGSDKKRIILIQCEDADTCCDIISCARFKIMKIVNELNSNFYFIFIVRLLVTEHPSRFAGFCGLEWDSVHIDELRGPHNTLLPTFDLIAKLSVAEIFDYKFPVKFNNSAEDDFHFKKKRLLGCIQTAVSRLIHPCHTTEERRAKRVELLSKILSDPKYSGFATIFCERTSLLLKQITIVEYSRDWSMLSVLRDNVQTIYPTVMKCLSHSIDCAIEPILGGILGIFDTLSNLNLVLSGHQEFREIWKVLSHDDLLLDFRNLTDPITLRSSVSFQNYSTNIREFPNEFPFFFPVYQQVTRLFNSTKMNIGKDDKWRLFAELFDDTSVGHAIGKIENKSILYDAYLKDFVELTTSFGNRKEFKVLYVMLVGATSYCWSETKCEWSECDPQSSVTIPSIHIAYDFLQKRIEFVKKAFFLGFKLPDDHWIHRFDPLKDPKTSKFRNIDFDFFNSIVKECSRNVHDFCIRPDAFTPIDSVLKCQYLIGECMLLFNKDFGTELAHLRYSWLNTHTIVLFAINVIKITEIQDLFKSQDYLKNSLKHLCDIVSQNDVSPQSEETFDKIFKLLKDMNETAWKNRSSDLDSLGISFCRKGRKDPEVLFDLFQIHVTRFFQEFLTNIIFSDAVNTPDVIIYRLLRLCLSENHGSVMNNSVDICLFQENQINPTSGLRCIILELIFRQRYQNIRIQLEDNIVEISKTVGLNRSTAMDDVVLIVLQSLENHHYYLAEHLAHEKQVRHVLELLSSRFLHGSTLRKGEISYEMLESVAILRFAIIWVARWYSDCNFKSSYIKSQASSSNTIKNKVQNTSELDNCLQILERITHCNEFLSKQIVLYLLKTLYFHIGYGEIVSHISRTRNWLFPKDQDYDSITRDINLDLFYGIDSKYKEILTSLNKEDRIAKLTRQMKEKSFNRNLLFAIFQVSYTHHMKTSKIEYNIEEVIQLLPSNLQEVAKDIHNNMFLNMPHFCISEKTHLNTKFIAGLLCHIADFLNHAEDNKFLKPLCLVHYDPSALLKKYLPAVFTNSLAASVHNSPHSLRIPQSTDPRRSVSMRYSLNMSINHDVQTPRVPHILGDPLERPDDPIGIRDLPAISVALLRTILHSIFLYTLQTKHRNYPTKIIKLVEHTGDCSCPEYFFLHLIQDITDVTTIINKTFEEAILIIHMLIDQLLSIKLDKRHLTCTDLRGSEDLCKWENAFEEIYMSKLNLHDDSVLREKMRNIFQESQYCDVSLLRHFYEEEEDNLNSKLWRRSDIAGYNHLLQVFRSQTSLQFAKYPILAKILNEKPLLAVTKYIPELISLRFKLVEKSTISLNDRKVLDLSISDFLHFYQRDDSNQYQEYFNQFISLKTVCDELMNQRRRLEQYYPEISVLLYITYNDTLIGRLISTSNQKGILTSLIHLLLEIHNSFIRKYAEKSPTSLRSTILLSNLTSNHLINYTEDLEKIIFSNANNSIGIGRTFVNYNFNGIENDLCDHFLLNKSLFQDDLDLILQERKLFENLQLLKFNIPQEVISEDIWNSIKVELNNSANISEMISLIEFLINFTSICEGRRSQTIKSYMYAVLKFPNDKFVISQKADDKFCLKHLSSIWHHLSIHRAKLFACFRKFSNVSDCYKIELGRAQFQDLKDRIDNRNIDCILIIFYDFILFALDDQLKVSPPSSNKLRESLIEFSKLSLVTEEQTEFIPESVLVAHVVSIWTNLVLHSRSLET